MNGFTKINETNPHDLNDFTLSIIYTAWVRPLYIHLGLKCSSTWCTLSHKHDQLTIWSYSRRIHQFKKVIMTNFRVSTHLAPKILQPTGLTRFDGAYKLWLWRILRMQSHKIPSWPKLKHIPNLMVLGFEVLTKWPGHGWTGKSQQ